MSDAVIAMTTTNSDKEAHALAESMVKEKLAACVQIIPRIESIYFWEGEVHDDQEYLLLIKTREPCVRKLKALIEKEHSYEVPEFLVLPTSDGLDLYLKWMKDVTKG